ncbi:MAG: redoxin family protein [Nitrospirota bacterium]|nr:redoxin family protein [Nitrospirota bacterium]
MNIPHENQKTLKLSMVHLVCVIVGIAFLFWTPAVFGKSLSLEEGQPIPVATLIGKEGESISLDTLKGQVTLVSIVPQLNTPVCDEQTHRFSEQNEGLDEFIAFVTMSTNTHTDQTKFAKEAKIHNMTFLSDAPDFHFGRQTGLLLEDIDILHRAVIVLDADSIIRYVEIVPMSQLPHFDQAYQAVQRLLPKSS